MTWKASDIKNLNLKHNLSDNKPAVEIPKSLPKGLNFIINHLIVSEIQFEQELHFLHNRRFRFDIAIWKPIKCAIEYEGLNFSGDTSKKSGHTTLSGFTSNCEKYNLAQIEGWIILRYTAMNYHDFPTDLYRLINKP